MRNSPVTKDKGQNLSTPNANAAIIPAKVARSVEEVKQAVTDNVRTSTELLQAVVKLYIACRDEEFPMKGIQAAEMTGCSPAYISRVWKATEAAVEKRNTKPLIQAKKLGFRGYLTEFLPEPKPRKKREVKLSEVSESLPFMELVEAIKARSKAELANLPTVDRAHVLDALEEAAKVARDAILGTLRTTQTQAANQSQVAEPSAQSVN